MQADSANEERAPEGRAYPRGPVPPQATMLASGILFIVVAAAGFWSLTTDPYLTLSSTGPDPGPAFVPLLALAVLALGGLIQVLLVAVQAWRAGGFTWLGEFTLARLWMPVALTVLTVIYAMLLPELGFVWSSFGYALICCAALHWRTGDPFTARYLVQIPLEAMFLVALIYGVFGYIIHVPLP